MNKILKRRKRRAVRNRAKMRGTSSIPRLSIFRSNTNLYIQLIDDEAGKTLISISTRDLDDKDKTKAPKTKQAEIIGKQLAELAIEKGIKEAVMDRGPYKYHGRIKAIADSARAAGLKI